MGSHKQSNLFEENEGVLEIKKHSALAQINNVTSLVQRKSINALLRIAKDQLKRDPMTQIFQVDLGMLKKLSGVGRNDNRELKRSLKSLVSLVIEYNILHKDEYERGAFPLLSYVKIRGKQRGETATVSFSLSPPILATLEKPTMFFRLNLLLQRGFKSKYGIALYELLLDYKGIKKIYIEIDKFRKLMGIQPEQYSIFAMLKKKVIDKAIEEINEKSDLNVSYEVERSGRKVI